MNCPQCQTPNQQDSAFCPNCGTRLAPAAAAAQSGGYAPQPGQAATGGYESPAGIGAGAGSPGYGSAAGAGQYPPPAEQPAAGYPPQDGGPSQSRPASSLPPFQFERTRLTTVDQIVGVASLVVLISIFLPWFSATGFGATGTASGESVNGWLWLVFVIDLFVLAYLLMRAGWEEQPFKVPVAHKPLLIGATGLQLLIVLIAFFDMPGNDGIAGISIGWAWGAFIGLLAALAAAIPVIVPAVRSYLDSRR